MPDVWAAPFPLLTGREAGPGTGPGFRDEGFPPVQVIQVTIPPPGPTGLPWWSATAQPGPFRCRGRPISSVTSAPTELLYSSRSRDVAGEM